jgi:ribosomal protein L37AE/L43A
MASKKTENRYCNHCKKTLKHERIRINSWRCTRCRTIHYPNKKGK